MYSYNPDRRGLSEVKLLDLEPWRLYPKNEEFGPHLLEAAPSDRLTIDRGTPIASIGSCFAREIKTWLKENGFHFIETATGPCTAAGSARYDRVYNSFTLCQEFERAFGRFDPIQSFWHFNDGCERLLDPHRKNVAWDDFTEMVEELSDHVDNVRRAFTEAHVVIVTLGQSEIWYDKRDGYVFPLVPPVQVYDPEIHGFRATTFGENLANLERVHELFQEHNPQGHLMLTVSPVPLRATFQQVNAVVANVGNKSMLRAVAEEFTAAHPATTTYFPSYEIVTQLLSDPFEDDNRHVKQSAVAEIMDVFEAWFVKSL